MENKNYTTKKITLDLWDPDLEKMVTEEAEQRIFKEPQLLENERNFEVGYVYYKPKFQNLQIITRFKNLPLETLLKIANSFNLKQVKIKKMISMETGKVDYFISYGPKSNLWDPESETFQTITNDLKFEKVYCYAITQIPGGNQIIHNKPIS